MNILLWILQVLLALHTFMGALWKFSSPPEAVSSLAAIPHGIWLAMSVVEILCSLSLILPAFHKRFSKIASIAALVIAVEMLGLCGVHLLSGESDYGPMIYWLIVAALSGFIAYGRKVLRPF